MVITIKLPDKVAEIVRRRAEELGLSLDSYLIEVIAQSSDPEEASEAYVEASKALLNEAREELKKGDLRQAAEKLWGSLALAVKAYALKRDKRRLTSHKELWEYKEVVVLEVGEWVRDSWNAGNSMHTCFYEGWCTEEDVKDSLAKIEKFVNEVASRMRSHREDPYG